MPLLLVGFTACNKHSLGMESESVSNRTRNASNKNSPILHLNSNYNSYLDPRTDNDYLDPKTDITFKKIFKTDKEVTASFLNSILELEGDDTIEIENFEDTENIASGREPKVTYFDILVKDKKGKHYIIEMQLAYEKHFKKRVTYYAADKYSEQLRKGGSYKLLKKVVCLTISGHMLFKDNLEQFGTIIHKKAYRREHLILDKETYRHDLEDLSWVFIEIPKFDKSIDDLEDNEERWCSFLRGDVKKESDSDKVSGHNMSIKKAIDQLRRSNYTEEQMNAYRRNIIDIANKNVTEQEKQEHWKKEGIKEGIKEDEEKERIKRKRKRIEKELKKGLKKNKSIDVIRNKIKSELKDEFSDDNEEETDNMIHAEIEKIESIERINVNRQHDISREIRSHG